MYKEMLDNQMNSKHYMRGLGNMTQIEKQMNKDDLIAYKNFDNK